MAITLLVASLLSCGGQPDAPVSPTVPPEFPAVILNGDFADPSILRDGEDYYLTHSSFHAVPGLPIWHSRNLKEWKMITRALSTYVGNVWAPEIVKHEDLFYIYFPANRTNWVITARSPVGPWSKPVDLKVGGIDPGHITGPDGKRYLHLSAGKAVELAADGLSVIGQPRTVYDGWQYPADWVVECFCLESPKLAVRQGKYYLTSAQGGTAGPATSHMAVSARADSPLGPWENSPHNPIVRTRSASERWWSKGHGTLFEGAEDKWYLVYHAFENGFRTLGRQVLIEPVQWTADGWVHPLQRDGEEFEPRVIRNHQIASDDFSGAELKLQWQFDGSQFTPPYVLEDGHLIVPSQANRLTAFYTLSGDHNFEATVQLSPTGSLEAGLVAYFGPENFVGMGRDPKGATLFRGARATPHPRVECADCEYFKLRLQNQALLLFYSRDGKAWIANPTTFDITAFQGNGTGVFPPLKLGIFARGKGNVRVDNFTYESLP